MFNATDVDPVVIVDEAVELAKELSTDDSPAFVNGVLARIADLARRVRRRAAAEPHTDCWPRRKYCGLVPDSGTNRNLCPM